MNINHKKRPSGLPTGVNNNNNNNSRMRKVIRMYYDSYERWNGDGFYPLVVRHGPCQTPIDIEFELYDGELTQVSGPRLMGYDADTKEQIIKIMLESFFKTQ